MHDVWWHYLVIVYVTDIYYRLTVDTANVMLMSFSSESGDCVTTSFIDFGMSHRGFHHKCVHVRVSERVRVRSREGEKDRERESMQMSLISSTVTLSKLSVSCDGVKGLIR